MSGRENRELGHAGTLLPRAVLLRGVSQRRVREKFGTSPPGAHSSCRDVSATCMVPDATAGLACRTCHHAGAVVVMDVPASGPADEGHAA